MKQIDLTTIAKANPAVDAELVRRSVELVRELNRQGIMAEKPAITPRVRGRYSKQGVGSLDDPRSVYLRRSAAGAGVEPAPG
ncbi:MAG: hypothetical protein ABSG86_08905 [Thermoguttaceae bacterium]